MNKEIRRFDALVNRALTLDEYIKECFGGLPNEYSLELEWRKLPVCNIGYNSESDTLKHIKRVSELLSMAVSELLRRGSVHDSSKLESPEKDFFDKYTPLLAASEYGSEEYKQMLKELKPGLKHHYEHNSHHPEHYKNGIDGMDLFDLIEMFFDWKAASERHNTGNIYKSIEHNKGRFSMSDQLVNIFINTSKNLIYESNGTAVQEN